MLLHFEPSDSLKSKLTILKKVIFKQFMQIPKSTNTVLAKNMLRKELETLALKKEAISMLKWKCRRNSTMYDSTVRDPPINALRGVPNTWSQLIKTQVKRCPACNKGGTITSRWHLKYA